MCEFLITFLCICIYMLSPEATENTIPSANLPSGILRQTSNLKSPIRSPKSVHFEDDLQPDSKHPFSVVQFLTSMKDSAHKKMYLVKQNIAETTIKLSKHLFDKSIDEETYPLVLSVLTEEDKYVFLQAFENTLTKNQVTIEFSFSIHPVSTLDNLLAVLKFKFNKMKKEISQPSLLCIHADGLMTFNETTCIFGAILFDAPSLTRPMIQLTQPQPLSRKEADQLAANLTLESNTDFLSFLNRQQKRTRKEILQLALSTLIYTPS